MSSNQSICGNHLLAALPIEEYKTLLPYLEPLSLEVKYVFYTVNQPIEYVYFLQSGVAALIVPMGNDSFVEVVTVGNESMIGLPVFLGINQISQTCISILPGEALRMRADIFQSEIASAKTLQILLQRYTLSLFNQIAHLSACNCLHSIKERCCRGLLVTQDLAQSQPLLITQKSLSQRLGVRRASINEVAIALGQAGLVRYGRGEIQILNRTGLEAEACGCYTKIRQEYDCLIAAYRDLTA